MFAVIDNASDSWNASISNLMIDVGGTKHTFLIVTADHIFAEETIKLKFMPTLSEDATNAGEPFVTSIVFINYGS